MLGFYWVCLIQIINENRDFIQKSFLEVKKKGILLKLKFLEITRKGGKIRPKFLEKGVFLRCWNCHALRLFRESCTTGHQGQYSTVLG